MKFVAFVTFYIFCVYGNSAETVVNCNGKHCIMKAGLVKKQTVEFSAAQLETRRIREAPNINRLPEKILHQVERGMVSFGDRVQRGQGQSGNFERAQENEP